MTAVQQIRFLCGQVGINVLVRFFFSWQLKFVDQQDAGGAVLLDASLVGMVFFAARIFDAVSDPVAGLLCDRWVESGRPRRQLLWFAFWIPALSLVLMFAPTHGWSSGGRWGAFVPAMFAFFVGYTFYAIPYWSLVRDYAVDSAEEQKNSEKLGVGVLLATAIIAVASPLVIDAVGYLWAAVVFALIGTALLPLPIQRGGAAAGRGASSASVATVDVGLGFFRRTGQALGHRRFVAVLCLFCGSQMAFTVMTAGAPFIVQTLLGGSERDVAKVLAPLLGTAIPCAIFAVGWFARRGWEWAVTRASLGLAAVYAGVAFLGTAVIGTPMTTAMLLFAAGGPMIAVILGLEAKAVVDCASESERELGGERTSLYFGVFNLVVKGLNGLASMLVGFLVKLSHRPGWERAAVRGIGILAGGLLGLGVSAYFALRRRGSDDTRDVLTT